MGRRWIPLRRLTPGERRRLRGLFRDPPNPRVHERALTIRLASAGRSPSEIVEVVGRSRTSIWRWIKDFNARGMGSLFMGTSPGAPPKADEEVRGALAQAVEANPRELEYPFTRWSAALLAEHIHRSVHVRLSMDTIRRVLHRMGYRYLRPKLDLKHKQDPAQVRRAKGQKAAAKKKSKPAPVTILWRFSTKQSFTSTPT